MIFKLNFTVARECDPYRIKYFIFVKTSFIVYYMVSVYLYRQYASSVLENYVLSLIVSYFT